MSIFSAFTEGLTPLKTAAAWRAALGLGSGVPVPVAEGGTGATDAGTARTNLGVPLATQSDQEAETAGKVVTSDVQHFGPSAAKAWAYVTVSGGVPTLVAGSNIASIVDSGVGLLTLNFTVPFSSANWVSVATCGAASGVGIVCMQNSTTPKAAGSVVLNAVVITDGGGSVDPVSYNFVGYGDQ